MKAYESPEWKKEFMCGKRVGRWVEKSSSIWFRLLYTGRNKEKKTSLNHQSKACNFEVSKRAIPTTTKPSHVKANVLPKEHMCVKGQA